MKFFKKTQEIHVDRFGFYKIKANILIGDYIVELEEIDEVAFERNTQNSVVCINTFALFTNYSFWDRLKIAFSMVFK